MSDTELSQIWRNTIGGRTYWDAPVYEQFFRTVRAVNRGLPDHDRIRVLLGDPPVDFSAIRSAADADELPAPGERDTFFADVVEREVLAEGRHALLIAGADHLHRGESTNDDPSQGNAGTLLSPSTLTRCSSLTRSRSMNATERMPTTGSRWRLDWFSPRGAPRG